VIFVVLQNVKASKLYVAFDEPQHAWEPRVESLPSEQENSIASFVAVVVRDGLPAHSPSSGPAAPDKFVPAFEPVHKRNASLAMGPVFENFAPAAPNSIALTQGEPAPETAPTAVFGASPSSVADKPLHKPHFTKRLVGARYYPFSANEPLKLSFEAGVKTVLAAQVQDGLEPKDVTVRLSPGSVVIDAWFANPSNLSALTLERIQRTLCDSDNLEHALLVAVSSILEFHDVANPHHLSFDQAPQCRAQMLALTQKIEANSTQPASDYSNGCNGLCGVGTWSWAMTVIILCVVAWAGSLIAAYVYYFVIEQDEEAHDIAHPSTERWTPIHISKSDQVKRDNFSSAYGF